MANADGVFWIKWKLKFHLFMYEILQLRQLFSNLVWHSKRQNRPTHKNRYIYATKKKQKRKSNIDFCADYVLLYKYPLAILLLLLLYYRDEKEIASTYRFKGNFHNSINDLNNSLSASNTHCVWPNNTRAHASDWIRWMEGRERERGKKLLYIDWIIDKHRAHCVVHRVYLRESTE